jgi:hypothetical protein
LGESIENCVSTARSNPKLEIFRDVSRVIGGVY